jgi:hypothetical protein
LKLLAGSIGVALIKSLFRHSINFIFTHLAFGLTGRYNFRSGFFGGLFYRYFLSRGFEI